MKAYGKFYSWEVVNDSVAIKQADKSFFLYAMASIPREITWFFHCDTLKKGERKNLNIVYKNKRYYAHIEQENIDANQTRLFYSSTLKELLVKEYKSCLVYPLLRFEKIEHNTYMLETFVEDNIVLHRDNIDIKTRLHTVKQQGLHCFICDFNYEEIYGELGNDFIEIYQEDTNYYCICSNCKSILQHKHISVSTLKQRLHNKDTKYEQMMLLED